MAQRRRRTGGGGRAAAGWLLGAALACAGCPRLPPEVAAEVAAPDGTGPNHFALRPPPAEAVPAADTAGLPR